MAATKTTLTLLIDKEKNRVLFAEADKDFVDILFSFLTLPMGTIIRLLGKQSNLGCMDRLYESVENLDTKYLRTEACRTMLLRPISAAEYACEKLTIKVDDTMPKRRFVCQKFDRNESCRWVSTVQNTRCQCGLVMDEEIILKKSWLDENFIGLDRNALFVKGNNVRFMISDDLQVMPACTEAGIFLLNKLGARNSTVFEEQIVDFGRDEVFNLLKCSLLSNTPLTDMFMRDPELNHLVKLGVKNQIQSHMEKDVTDEPGKIKVKLFLSKSSRDVLYGEAGEDLVDLLFSFLVLPMGSIVKQLGGNSSMGSIDNLYKSVEDLEVSEYMTSDYCKSMLLSPKLPPYFGCDNQLTKILEMLPYDDALPFYPVCGPTVLLSWMNPKSPDPVTKSGGGYVMGPVKFMVTDEMVVKPLSFVSIIDVIHQLKKPIFDVKEKEVCLGEAEVLALLRATLITRTALNSVFSQKRDPYGKVKVEEDFLKHADHPKVKVEEDFLEHMEHPKSLRRSQSLKEAQSEGKTQ